MPLDGRIQDFETTETKHDVFSLEGLIAWLETQEPTTRYDFNDQRDCVLCRYLKSHGLPASSWNDESGNDNYRRASALEGAATGHILASAYHIKENWTYGRLLTRARALLSKSPK